MKYLLRRVVYRIVYVSCVFYTSSVVQAVEASVETGSNAPKALMHKELSEVLVQLNEGKDEYSFKVLEAFGLKLSPVQGQWKLLRRDSEINPDKASYMVYEGNSGTHRKKVQVIFSLIPKNGWEAMLKQTSVSLIKVGAGIVNGHSVTVYYHKVEKVVILVFHDFAYVEKPGQQDTVLPMYATVAVGNILYDSSPDGIQKVLDTYVRKLFATLSVTDKNTFAVETTTNSTPLQLKYTPSLEAKTKPIAEDNIFGKLQADLDHDERLETVAWKKFSVTELGDFYQLLVYDDDGSILWKGPNKADDTNPLVFFSLHSGVSLPQVLVDIDLDGKIELLAPMAQSDVSPIYYRKLRWLGDHFESLLPSALMYDIGSNNRFVWKEAIGIGGTWVSRLSHAKNGEIVAEITQMRDYGGVDMGEVSMVFDTKGAMVKRVLRPPEKVGGDTVTSPFEGTPPDNSVVQAPVQKSNAYQARISERDHYNSRGARLRNLASVLRQDRANYYKYGGDKGDQSDRYFSAIRNRDAMERIRINPIGISYRGLQDLVVYDTPLLEVEIERSQLNIRVLER